VCCSLSLQLFMSHTGKIISPYEFFFRFVGGLYHLAEIVNSLISSNSPYNCIITCEYETRGSSFAVTVRISLDLFRPKLYNISLAVTHTNVCKPTVLRKEGWWLSSGVGYSTSDTAIPGLPQTEYTANTVHSTAAVQTKSYSAQAAAAAVYYYNHIIILFRWSIDSVRHSKGAIKYFDSWFSFR